MTNQTCPHDHSECTQNNGPIDFDGYLNCRECPRHKEGAEPTNHRMGFLHVDHGSPEGDKCAKVIVCGSGEEANIVAKSLVGRGIDIVIVDESINLPERKITESTRMKFCSNTCASNEQMSREG